MIFLIVFGGLMLILGGFYLANSWQQYHEWKGGTVIVILSLAAVIYGVINLPAFNRSKQNSSSEASSSQVMSNSGSTSFSNKANIGSTDNSASQENKEMAILRQLQKGYSKFGDVSFDSKTKTYKVTPTDDNTVNALKQLAQDPSQAQQMGWSKLTNSFKKNSKDIDKAIGDDYSLSIMNPADDSQAMYTAKNGKTTYDIANQ